MTNDFTVPPSEQLVSEALSSKAKIAGLVGLTHILSKRSVEALKRFLRDMSLDLGTGEEMEFYVSVINNCFYLIQAEAEEAMKKKA